MFYVVEPRIQRSFTEAKREAVLAAAKKKLPYVQQNIEDLMKTEAGITRLMRVGSAISIDIANDGARDAVKAIIPKGWWIHTTPRAILA